MAYCVNCGKYVEDSLTVCPACGAPAGVAPAAPAAPAPAKKAYGKPKTSGIVLSTINIAGLFFGNFIGYLLGMVALVLTLIAPSTGTAEEEKNLNKAATVMNVVGLILGVFAVIITVLIIVAAVISFIAVWKEVWESGGFTIPPDPSVWGI